MLRRLSAYDVECGIAIDAAFASFQGADPSREGARVFAALAHRRTRGRSDGTNNPLGVEGAGWVGFVGIRPGAEETTVFASVTDGCRAAALVMHSDGFVDVQAAYRARDAIRLARALEGSPIRSMVDARNLEAEVAALRGRWWSVLADLVSFRRVLTAATSAG